jgi:hypothetical protein
MVVESNVGTRGAGIGLANPDEDGQTPPVRSVEAAGGLEFLRDAGGDDLRRNGALPRRPGRFVVVVVAVEEEEGSTLTTDAAKRDSSANKVSPSSLPSVRHRTGRNE